MTREGYPKSASETEADEDRLHEWIAGRIEARRAAGRRPLNVTIQEVYSSGLFDTEINRELLRRLISRGALRWGKTMSGYYVTLPTL